MSKSQKNQQNKFHVSAKNRLSNELISTITQIDSNLDASQKVFDYLGKTQQEFTKLKQKNSKNSQKYKNLVQEQKELLAKSSNSQKNISIDMNALAKDIMSKNDNSRYRVMAILEAVQDLGQEKYKFSFDSSTPIKHSSQSIVSFAKRIGIPLTEADIRNIEARTAQNNHTHPRPSKKQKKKQKKQQQINSNNEIPQTTQSTSSPKGTPIQQVQQPIPTQPIQEPTIDTSTMKTVKTSAFDLIPQKDGTYTMDIRPNKFPLKVNIDDGEGVAQEVATPRLLLSLLSVANQSDNEIKATEQGITDFLSRESFLGYNSAVFEKEIPSKVKKSALREIAPSIQEGRQVYLNVGKSMREAFGDLSSQGSKFNPIRKHIAKMETILSQQNNHKVPTLTLKGLNLNRVDLEGVVDTDTLIKALSNQQVDSNKIVENMIKNQLSEEQAKAILSPQPQTNIPSGKNVYLPPPSDSSPSVDKTWEKSYRKKLNLNGESDSSLFKGHGKAIGIGVGLLAAGLITKELIERDREKNIEKQRQNNLYEKK